MILVSTLYERNEALDDQTFCRGPKPVVIPGFVSD